MIKLAFLLFAMAMVVQTVYSDGIFALKSHYHILNLNRHLRTDTLGDVTFGNKTVEDITLGNFFKKILSTKFHFLTSTLPMYRRANF
jgi:hypothetical protein